MLRTFGVLNIFLVRMVGNLPIDYDKKISPIDVGIWGCIFLILFSHNENCKRCSHLVGQNFTIPNFPSQLVCELGVNFFFLLLIRMVGN